MRNPLGEALERLKRLKRLKRQYGDETFWREVNINGHLQGEFILAIEPLPENVN